MKSEIRFIGTNWRVHFTIGLFLTIVVIFLATTYRFEFGLILLAVAGSIVVMAITITVGIVSKLIFKIRMSRIELGKAQQQLRLTTYQADKAQLEAFVLSFPKTQRIITLPDSPIRVIEALPETSRLALPETMIKETPLDLLKVFTQPSQSYACIGGQQTGKTYQMRHIANHWLSKGFTPVVVGPKWDRGEWAGCVLFGGNGDFAGVSKGIAIVRQEAQKRHADSDKHHKEHSILPVFFDDWTPIVDAVDYARELVLQATTLYASVNIILYFVLHSDTANAWGVDRKGAALKDNFIKLFIVPHYDDTGLIARDKTRGFIQFAGESERRPVKLFHTPIIPNGQPMESDGFINLEVEPTPTEAHILNLWEQGESISTIAAEVYAHKGGNQNDQVKQILNKYGVNV